MFCCYCGKTLPDDAVFCAFCGKATPADIQRPEAIPVEEQSVSSTTHQTESLFVPAAPECQNPPKSGFDANGYRLTQYGTAEQSRSYYKPKQNNINYRSIFIKKWRKFVSSPLVIVSVILFCISTIISISATQDSFSALYDVMDLLQLDDVSSGMMLLQSLSFLPSILICIGMILIVVDGHRSELQPVSTAGLHIIRTTLLVVVAITGILLLSCIVIILQLSDELSSFGRSYNYQIRQFSEISGAIIVGILIGIGIGAFYYFCIFSALNSALYGIQNGSTDNRKIIALAVFQFITAGFSLIAIFLNENVNFTTFMSLASTICIGIVLVKYNTMLDDIYYWQIHSSDAD